MSTSDTGPKVTVETFVVFHLPGLVIGEQYRERVDDINPYAIDWPKNAYAFHFVTQHVVTLDGMKMRSEECAHDPIYYHPHSVVRDAAWVARNDDSPMLLSNMRCNGWAQVIYTRWGNWPQPWNADKMEILK